MILTGHEDLRIQKTIQAIRESLKSLILEKEFSDIKVTALCQRAKISKKTFYAYYTCLDDLFNEELAIIAEGMLNALPVLNSAISKVSATIQTGLLKSSTAAQRLMSFETMPMQNLRTTLATAAANPPQLNPVPSASAGGGITYEQLLALFNMVIAAIRENGGDIVIGDEYIGRANARYIQDRSIVTGGAVF